MKKKSAKAKATTQKLQDRSPLQCLWSLDLATVEQRMSASALHWDIVPPSVQYLNYVGQNRLLVGTHQHLQLIDASSGQSDLDLVHNDAWYSGMLSTLLTTDNGLFVMADMEHTVVRTIETGDVVFECRHSHRVASTAISTDGQRLRAL